LTIPAKGSVSLATGKGHVMIERLFGTLRAGQSVNIELDFAHAGSVNVVAPVVAVGAPVPIGGHS
jgi:copper(I)-binding protein